MTATVLSLFAGIGGLDLGIERAGLGVTKWYSEVDPYASRIMAARFPDAVNLGDITTINWNEFNERPDIITGGFPCQDISLAGAGAGIAAGTRSGLWSCYADAIGILRPRIVIVENVAALLARGMGRVLGDLAACGYDAEWDCIPAANVGAPHKRDRIFIIAYPHRERTQVQIGGQYTAEQVARWPRASNGHWRWQQEWATESGVGGSNDGLPYFVDGNDEPGVALGPWGTHSATDRWKRITCLGNAVVPQVAEHVARIAKGKLT